MELKVKRTNMRDSELFHSSSFLGEEFSDELYHWKYIKKKKVNGKWRYYYNKGQLKDDLGYDERERMRAAEKDEFEAMMRYAAAKSNLDTNNNGKLHLENKDGKFVPDEYTKAVLDTGDAYVRAIERHDKARSEFYKTPLGLVPGIADKISRGVSYIERLFEKKKITKMILNKGR